MNCPPELADSLFHTGEPNAFNDFLCSTTIVHNDNLYLVGNDPEQHSHLGRVSVTQCIGQAFLYYAIEY